MIHRVKFFLLVTALVTLLIAPLAGMAQQSEQAEDAENLVLMLLDGDYAAVYERFNDQVKDVFTLEQLEQAVNSIASVAGEFQGIDGVREEGNAVIVTTRFALITLDARIVYDADGAVAGLNFAAAANPEPTVAPVFATPSYAVPDAFSETDVIVGEYELPGTLTTPNTTDLVPAVVLLSGSGPNDRDETVEQVKPMRDIAWGLASQGVASVRFDKRTLAALDSIDMDTFTLEGEYIEDAVAAVALLRRTEGIDPDRVYVLGHSLGGYAAPRVAAAAPDEVAGVIVLAGLASPLPETILEQTRYLLSLNGELTASQQASLDVLAGLVEQINALTEDSQADQLLLGATPAYWLDLRDYDPVALAASLDEPMLILQGERDYQVTVERDLTRWQEGLGDRADVTIITYDDLNHLFMTGEGMSTPAEYSEPGNVAQEVIDDIAGWVLEQ